MKHIKFDTNTSDEILIEATLSGQKDALELLLKKHQDWVFNIALNFTGDTHEAADVVQEVMIKVFTKLSSFKQNSSFRTWLYRIAKNHFLNMKRGRNEISASSFDQFGQGLNQIKDESLSNYKYEAEEKLLVKEAKLSCMKGMLLCLNREQRLIYIIGEMFEFGDTIGSEIMEISKANFRVKLHRAKKQLYSFMENKCGLINKNNPCRCARKTAAFIKMGYVDPIKLNFQKNRVNEINKVIEKRVNTHSNEITKEYQKLYQEHYFQASPDKLFSIRKLLFSDNFKNTFDLN